MRIAYLAAFLLSTTAAYADDHKHEEHAEHDSHLAELGEVHLLHAWTPASEDGDVLVFMEIENEGHDSATLLGAHAHIASKVELVGFDLKDGHGHYEPLPKLPVAAGAHMVLAPNGVAFHLSGVSEHLHQGDEFEMHIEFAAGEVEMMVQVEAAGATQHSHAGHNH